MKDQQAADDALTSSLAGCADLQQQLLSWQQEAQGRLQQLTQQVQEVAEAVKAEAEAEAQAAAEAEAAMQAATAEAAERLREEAIVSSTSSSGSTSVKVLADLQEQQEQNQGQQLEGHWPTFNEDKAKEELVPLKLAIKAAEQQLEVLRKETTSMKVQLDMKVRQIREYELLVPASAAAFPAGNGNGLGNGSGSAAAAAAVVPSAAVVTQERESTFSDDHTHHHDDGSPVCDRCGQVIDLEMYQR